MGRDLLRSRTFLFVVFMMMVTYLYWFFGVSNYGNYEAYGQQVTFGIPNSFGYLILMLPLILVFYMYWKKWRMP